MPRGPKPAVAITLAPQERATLEARARATTTPQREALRAKIILRAAAGESNLGIANALGCDRGTPIKWRKRFAAQRLEGLRDAARPGRDPVYDSATRAAIIGLACQLPAERDLPLSRISVADVRKEAVKLVSPCPSESTIRSILNEDAIKPWRYRSWIHRRDPKFQEKAGRVLDLYAGVWDGQALDPKQDVVVSVDEKTSIQALERVHPTQAPAPGRPGRTEFEYKRHGVVGLVAVLFVATGTVLGQCMESNSKKNFRAFVRTLMATPTCLAARRVFLVLDNGSAHHPKTFQKWLNRAFPRLQRAFPKVIAVHTPTHASWLNQVEIFFSILTRKALTPRDVASVEALRRLILRFIDLHNQTAKPYKWKFTRADMDRVLARIDEVLTAVAAAAPVAA